MMVIGLVLPSHLGYRLPVLVGVVEVPAVAEDVVDKKKPRSGLFFCYCWVGELKYFSKVSCSVLKKIKVEKGQLGICLS